MCKFWSAIIDRNGKVWWSKDDSSHEALVKLSGWKDDKLKDRDFVRIEITPRERNSIFSKKEKDWVFRVDEKKTLPAWFSSNEKKNEKLCWAEWKKAMKQTLWKLRLERARRFLDEIPKIPYLTFSGAVRKEWHLSIGKDLDAAWDAAGDAALWIRVLLCPKIEMKHKIHAEARMDVWRQGYGLRYDVNGKLYVYGVRK